MPGSGDFDFRRRSKARRNLAIFWLVLIGIPVLACLAYAVLWAVNPLKG